MSSELVLVARDIAAKGILAADESIPTIKKRFDQIHVENSREKRRAYRELLFTAPQLSDYVSAAILFEETLFDRGNDGKTQLVQHLQGQGIVPGIKVDKGLKPLPGGAEGETITQGLDDLAQRCADYYQAGARFTKFRVLFKVNESGSAPSALAIRENAAALARFAAISQTAGLVPVVEPEVLMQGDHSIEQAFTATKCVLVECFKAMFDHKVRLDCCLLKPNMVRSGETACIKSSALDIAQATLRCMKETVPFVLPGIMFLSGGMTESEATLSLNEINRLAHGQNLPWRLSFSFGRALQHSCLRIWQGEDEHKAAAQQKLVQMAKNNFHASLGEFNRTQ